MGTVELAPQSRVRAGCGASTRRPVLRPGFPRLCPIPWPPRNSLRALRPLRSDSRGESEDEALRAPRDRTKPRRLAHDAPQPARTRLCGRQFWYSVPIFRECQHGWLRGRRCPLGAHSGAAAMIALGSGAQRFVSSSSRLFERRGLWARSEFRDADPRAIIAAKSAQSADRHGVSPQRAAPAAKREEAATRDKTAVPPRPYHLGLVHKQV